MSADAFRAHFADHPSIAAYADRIAFTERGCWEFPVGPGFPYAKRKTNGRPVFLHRLSLEIKLGEPLGKLVSRHQCDNPPCCNPAHLEPGTMRDNFADMWKRGRHTPGVIRGIENSKATCTAEQVAEALSLLDAGWTRTAVAEKFGVTRRAVQQWQLGLARKDGLNLYLARKVSA